ncbi:MAG TPA: DUF4352 domain-containing protein [Bryobacteraceae bacterium]|nr:DUF4352 domain-containing protein [Bryobacteraceae bacterium]
MRVSRGSAWIPVAVAVWLVGCSSQPAAPPMSTYGLGERAPVGHLTYTVFETQWVTHFGDGVDARLPQNRFFLIRLSAVNGGSSDAIVPNFTIEDDKGHVYQELSDGEGVPQWIGYLRSAKPADFVQGNIVFDAPPAHYKLKLTDGQQHAAIVDIPLSFGAETPDLLSAPAPDPLLEAPDAASKQPGRK